MTHIQHKQEARAQSRPENTTDVHSAEQCGITISQEGKGAKTHLRHLHILFPRIILDQQSRFSRWAGLSFRLCLWVFPTCLLRAPRSSPDSSIIIPCLPLHDHHLRPFPPNQPLGCLNHNRRHIYSSGYTQQRRHAGDGTPKIPIRGGMEADRLDMRFRGRYNGGLESGKRGRIGIDGEVGGERAKARIARAQDLECRKPVAGGFVLHEEVGWKGWVGRGQGWVDRRGERCGGGADARQR